MTREEAIEWIKAHHDYQMDGCKDSEVMRMAIKALEQESCEDAISRQEALEFVTFDNCEYRPLSIPVISIREFLEELPRVKPVSRIAKFTFDKDMLQGIVDGFVESEFGNYISRQDAIDAILYDHLDSLTPDERRNLIEDLPPVIPKQETSEWIPCSERLPEAGVTVLVTSDHGYVYTSCFRHGEFEYGGNAIAWMPLPDPYKGGE